MVNIAFISFMMPSCFEMDRAAPLVGWHRVSALWFDSAYQAGSRIDPQPHRQRYRCHGCARDFDDLTGTVLAGHHQPLRVWILCLYFMGLNLSNRQIAQELGLNKDDVQHMTTHLRQGLVDQQEPASS